MARLVLVADDSPTIQKRALGILKDAGFEVETVSNGVAAIKRLAVLHPSLILADVSMPGRDGYEVCDFVKKSPGLAHVPVLLVASDMEPYDSARGTQVRADAIIKKPFESHELIALVDKFALRRQPTASPPTPSPALGETRQEIASFAVGVGNDASSNHGADSDLPRERGGGALTQSAQEKEAPPTVPAAAPGGTSFAEFELSGTAFTESAFEPASEAADEHSAGPASQFTAGSFSEAPATTRAAHETSIFNDLSAAKAPEEPVLMGEQPPETEHADPHEHGHDEEGAHTQVFGKPTELTGPAWEDETIAAVELDAPAPAADPAPKDNAPPATTPQSWAPAFRALDADFSATVTNLDSFSLEEAAGGHVHFTHGERGRSGQGAESNASADTLAADLSLREGPQPSGSAAPGPVDPAAETVIAAAPPPGIGPEAAGLRSSPSEAVSGPVYAEPIPFDSGTELSTAEIKLGPASEGFRAAPVAAGSANSSSPSPAGPSFDWNLFYFVVQKVVAKMAPPVLAPETIEDITRRLADEIAVEITSGPRSS